MNRVNAFHGFLHTKQDAYQKSIEAAGFTLELMRKNSYEFISEQAQNASAKYGVKSVSILARKL